MLRLISILALFFALFLPLFLPKSKLSGQASRSQSARKRPQGLGKMVFLVLVPLMPGWIVKSLQWFQGPSCPRCQTKVGRQDTTCAHCGNVLSSISYRVEKAI